MPPTTLGPTGQAYWTVLHETFTEIGEQDEPLVLALCCQVDRLDQIRQAIREQGVTVINRFGRSEPNKLLSEERSTSLTAGRLWRELGLGAAEGTDPARMVPARGYR